jgi:predicted dehydrogenase
MYARLFTAAAVAVCFQSAGMAQTAKPTVRIMTLDPGHYHAALVQKEMYDQVDPVVHVYAPPGEDLDLHLQKIDLFNTRPDNPTRWITKVYTGSDYLERMLRDRPGNLVVLAGNKSRTTRYILECVKAGLHVLSDKPMAINPRHYEMLLEAFKIAEEKNVLLYDIMTERYEITTIMQRELSMVPEVFGRLQTGTPDQPAVTKESVHHFSKTVAGKPLKRPAWFFDVEQEGEGLNDVGTHLADLVQWECFPEQILKTDDVKMLSARRWSTAIAPEQFKKVTGLDSFPDFLKKDIKEGVLHVPGNGEMIYTLKGHYAKVSVAWRFEPPPGAEDTHYSIMRGSRANLIIEQGPRQKYKPVLYVENRSGEPDDVFQQKLEAALKRINERIPGVTFKKGEGNWEIVIPDALKTNHEQHFAQVTEKYLSFLAQGRMPAWEVPNMIVKYYTLMEAYKASR